MTEEIKIQIYKSICIILSFIFCCIIICIIIKDYIDTKTELSIIKTDILKENVDYFKKATNEKIDFCEKRFKENIDYLKKDTNEKIDKLENKLDKLIEKYKEDKDNNKK